MAKKKEKLKHHGTFEVLQQAVTKAGYSGTWQEESDCRRFDGRQGEILKWWPLTHTLNFQVYST